MFNLPTNEEDYYEMMYPSVGDSYQRCPVHGEIISNGLFDAPCGGCEAEMEDASHAWDYDPENNQRPYCRVPDPYLYIHSRFPATCLDVEDNIPF